MNLFSRHNKAQPNAFFAPAADQRQQTVTRDATGSPFSFVASELSPSSTGFDPLALQDYFSKKGINMTPEQYFAELKKKRDLASGIQQPIEE